MWLNFKSADSTVYFIGGGGKADVDPVVCWNHTKDVLLNWTLLLMGFCIYYHVYQRANKMTQELCLWYFRFQQNIFLSHNLSLKILIRIMVIYSESWHTENMIRQMIMPWRSVQWKGFWISWNRVVMQMHVTINFGTKPQGT